MFCFFISAMTQSKCILTADFHPCRLSSGPIFSGNHFPASHEEHLVCTCLFQEGVVDAWWHRRSTALIYLYPVSPSAGKMAWGFLEPYVSLKKAMCQGRGSWFCCSSSWCHCPPFSMWHERPSPMPDKGGQPMWHKPEANGRSAGND